MAALSATLESAVHREDFAEAARVHAALAACEEGDAVAEVLRELDDALKEQRFADAARLRDAGAGLIGWWAGRAEPVPGAGPDQPVLPHGCIMQVYPSAGRFVGHVYSAHELAELQELNGPDNDDGFEYTAGRPVLELFVVREEDGTVRQQAVAVSDVRHVGGDGVPTVLGGLTEVLEVDIGPQFDGGDDGAADTAAPEEAKEPDTVFDMLERQMKELSEKGGMRPGIEFDTAMDWLTEAASSGQLRLDSSDLPPGLVSTDAEGGNDEDEDEFELMAMRRAPASLSTDGLNSFVFEFDAADAESKMAEAAAAEAAEAAEEARRPWSPEEEEEVLARMRSLVDEISEARTRDTSAQDKAELKRRMKETIEDVLGPEGLLKEQQDEAAAADQDGMDAERADEAMEASSTGTGQDQCPMLSSRTRFHRIDAGVAAGAGVDPFDQLYVGAFGPHGPEVLQLTRGQWGEEQGHGDDHVTAVKLTGDANVPAGRASFRARVGKDYKLDPHVGYPPELGVVARYKGEGRVAKPGFVDSSWVEGELLVLDGQGGQLTGGAQLGFVWAVPGERRFLILFSKLALPA